MGDSIHSIANHWDAQKIPTQGFNPHPRRSRDTNWKQVAAQGAANLSLRAIARQIEVTAPALYRYYPSRDDLVTDLIVEDDSKFSWAFGGHATSHRQAVRKKIAWYQEMGG